MTKLSRREAQVVKEVAKGLSNTQVGAVLGITEGTVKVYLHTVFTKLGVTSRKELVGHPALQ